MRIQKTAFIFLFLQFFFLNFTFAQKLSEVDKIVAKYPKSLSTTEKLAEKIQEDFQTNRNVVYGNKTGVLTEAVANPSATGINTSALVGRYVRNSSELYDVFNIKKFLHSLFCFEEINRLFAIGFLVHLEIYLRLWI